MKPGLTLASFALGWAALTGVFTLPNLLLGAPIGWLALYLFTGLRERQRVFRRIRRLAGLTVLFVLELIQSAIRVAILVLRPGLRAHLAPAVVAFPLSAKSDAEITLLANLITLTPGTLSIDVSADRRTLLVHALECRDEGALVRSIADGFEKRVVEALR